MQEEHICELNVSFAWSGFFFFECSGIFGETENHLRSSFAFEINFVSQTLFMRVAWLPFCSRQFLSFFWSTLKLLLSVCFFVCLFVYHPAILSTSPHCPVSVVWLIVASHCKSTYQSHHCYSLVWMFFKHTHELYTDIDWTELRVWTDNLNWLIWELSQKETES